MVKNVKNGAIALFLALVCFAPVATVRAENTPYNIIAKRNIFSLGEEKVVVIPDPPKPPTDVKLIGIMTILGSKHALLSINRDGKTSFLTFCEGQQFGGVEVLEINPAARSVKIRKDSQESTISFAAAEPKK